MQVACSKNDSLGIIRFIEGPDQEYPELFARLDAFLTTPDLKALIIAFETRNSPFEKGGRGDFQQTLVSAHLPVAAILPVETDNELSQFAGTCDFVFSSESRSLAELEGETEAYLKSLTERRPPQVIRAVMAAIRGARDLPIEKALKNETTLFCELASANHRLPEKDDRR
jgi:hypothetical protein